MLFANVNGEKFEAKPQTTGLCPLCEHPVFSKCGEVNVWHWAHYKDESCDNWYEPETEWHKNWKLIFGKDKSEIIIAKDGKRHIADILTNDNVVIELQNSPLQKPIIRKREEFYGERMIWVLNGKPFKHNFDIREYSPSGLSRHFGVVDKVHKDNLSFSWNWCRRSWDDVQRNLFIDFGDETLFWAQEGMGTRFGRGRQVSKEKFVTKYGGDIELLPTIIDSSNENTRR